MSYKLMYSRLFDLFERIDYVDRPKLYDLFHEHVIPELKEYMYPEFLQDCHYEISFSGFHKTIIIYYVRPSPISEYGNALNFDEFIYNYIPRDKYDDVSLLFEKYLLITV